eukprot:885317-Pelagomonas_calceolata.AAC.5
MLKISLPAAPCVGSRMVVWRTRDAYLCKTSRLLNVEAYESGKEHKERAVAWQQAQKDKVSWQQRVDKGTEYKAQRHEGQAADPNVHTLFAGTKQELAAGEPCARAFKKKEFSTALCPYPAAIGKWLNASKNGHHELEWYEQKHTSGSIEIGLSSIKEQQNSLLHKQCYHL